MLKPIEKCLLIKNLVIWGGENVKMDPTETEQNLHLKLCILSTNYIGLTLIT
jgi:hypothetical protein